MKFDVYQVFHAGSMESYTLIAPDVEANDTGDAKQQVCFTHYVAVNNLKAVEAGKSPKESKESIA